jgi:hypothetical protein
LTANVSSRIYIIHLASHPEVSYQYLIFLSFILTLNSFSK